MKNVTVIDQKNNWPKSRRNRGSGSSEKYVGDGRNGGSEVKNK